MGYSILDFTDQRMKTKWSQGPNTGWKEHGSESQGIHLARSWAHLLWSLSKVTAKLDRSLWAQNSFTQRINGVGLK